MFLNGVGERILGYSCAEVLRMNIAELMAPEFVGYVGDLLRHYFIECFGLVYEIEIVAKGGRRVSLETSTHVTLRNDGQIVIEGVAVPTQSGTARRETRSNIRCLDPDFAFCGQGSSGPENS